MVIQDIALFKSFIESNTLREIFIRGYRKSAHFSNNPASIEQYFAEVKAEEVIKKGITLFSTNQTFGYDFWQNTHENWLIKLKKGRMGKSYTDYDKLIELEGMFKILRENWDAVKSWAFESVEKTLKRLGLQEDIAEDSKEEEEKVVEVINPAPKEDFSGVPEFDEEFEFFDLNTGSRSRSNKLKKDECSLNFRSNSYKLTMNQEITKKIKTNMYKYVRLGKTKTGDIILQLHKEDSASPVNITYNSRKGESAVNACINSKDLCDKLKVLLNLTGDYFILHIEELSANYDKATYKIRKK
jgi:hypothetical protein